MKRFAVQVWLYLEGENHQDAYNAVSALLDERMGQPLGYVLERYSIELVSEKLGEE
jgi:hypothetical protein